MSVIACILIPMLDWTRVDQIAYAKIYLFLIDIFQVHMSIGVCACHVHVMCKSCACHVLTEMGLHENVHMLLLLL